MRAVATADRNWRQFRPVNIGSIYRPTGDFRQSYTDLLQM